MTLVTDDAPRGSVAHQMACVAELMPYLFSEPINVGVIRYRHFGWGLCAEREAGGETSTFLLVLNDRLFDQMPPNEVAEFYAPLIEEQLGVRLVKP